MNVLDASVVLKGFVEEVDSEKAIQLRDEYYAREREIVVPDFLLIEVANVLRYHPDLELEDIYECLGTLFDMAIDIVTPTLQLLNRSVALAKKFDITCYDDIYLALAQDLKFTFITADEKLFHKVMKTRNVKLLGNI